MAIQHVAGSTGDARDGQSTNVAQCLSRMAAVHTRQTRSTPRPDERPLLRHPRRARRVVDRDPTPDGGPISSLFLAKFLSRSNSRNSRRRLAGTRGAAHPLRAGTDDTDTRSTGHLRVRLLSPGPRHPYISPVLRGHLRISEPHLRLTLFRNSHIPVSKPRAGDPAPPRDFPFARDGIAAEGELEEMSEYDHSWADLNLSQPPAGARAQGARCATCATGGSTSTGRGGRTAAGGDEVFRRLGGRSAGGAPPPQAPRKYYRPR